MKTILAALALIVSTNAFATEAFSWVSDSKIQFAAVQQDGLKTEPMRILTKPIKIEGRVFIGTDVGLYQLTQTRAGLKGTLAFSDCRALTEYKWLDCQPIEDLAASPDNATHARVLMGENYVMFDLYLGRAYSIIGTLAKDYQGSM